MEWISTIASDLTNLNHAAQGGKTLLKMVPVSSFFNLSPRNCQQRLP
jgi:hypothetical protein